MSLDYSIIDCQVELHAESIRHIFNHAILHTTALYDYHPRSIETVHEWFAVKQHRHFPVIGAVTSAGEFLGFATYGTFRDKDGYRFTVEHSVYVDHRHTGQGIGKRLMQELITKARQQGYHIMIGGIDAQNTRSVRFHEHLGFLQCGYMREVGYKFDQWLDVVFYQLKLD